MRTAFDEYERQIAPWLEDEQENEDQPQDQRPDPAELLAVLDHFRSMPSARYAIVREEASEEDEHSEPD